MPTLDPTEDDRFELDVIDLEAVKAALKRDRTDWGIGVLHLPTGRIILRSASSTQPVAHGTLVDELALNRADCRGFAITITSADDFVIENFSGLNIGSGGPTGLKMPEVLFDRISRTLFEAGL